ncbi:MAG: hypothetical protein XXXJIFNMEKO3_00717 [Candidatus Erwinia impunctatus]|nr:hypothetical protein XXXJIFNMEKO_00717 [Culicoides impunctatus]
MNKLRGFTLAELMVVMMILAIMGGVSLHSRQRWQQHQQLLQNARQIQHFLIRLRLDAHWYNRARVIDWKPDKPHCLKVVGGADCRSPGRDSVLVKTSQVMIESITEGMGFYGRENVARPGRIVIRNPSGSVHIIVSTRGRVRLCHYSEAPC